MKRAITKDEVNELEVGAYQGTIYVADDEKSAKEAIAMLQNESLLGFDTETRPSFKKGEQYTPSLLQFAASDFAVLFRIHETGLPDGLLRIFQSEKIIKIGIAIDRDLKELKDIASFEESGFIDLNTMAPQKGFENVGVRRLAAMVLGIRISKRQQTSNWEADQLKPAQIEYAATDAWVCREIYLKIKDL
jgi:ribonuclease D